MMFQVFEIPPEDFSPLVEVAAIYVEVNKKCLWLQIGSTKSEEGKWGIPCGKLEANESSEHAARRELFEETGIKSEKLDPLGTLYMRKSDHDYVYHMFSTKFDHFPEVVISREHQSYHWASEEEAKKLPLMTGGEEALQAYYRIA